jgi:signal recognition particle subunit SRP54
MVLADLGAKIQAALRKLNTSQTIDEKLLNEIITEIANALLSSDVNIKYIAKL